MAPIVTVSNLIMGPGWLYRGAFGATEPLNAAVNAPLAVTGFSNVGGTMDGADLEIVKTYTDLAVDQIVDIPGARVTARTVNIKTNIAEPTLNNLAFALNEVGGVTGGAGFEEYQPNDDISSNEPDYSALVFEGFAPSGLRRWVILRKVLSIANVTFAYKKDTQSVFAVTFRAHYVSGAIRPFRIVDEIAV